MKNPIVNGGVAMLLTLAVAISAATTPAAAKDWTKVRIGTEGAYPPFNYVDENGVVQGFEIDLAKAMCQAIEVECEFIVQDWDGIIPGLLAKKYDAVIASLYITEERKQKIDFTQKYYQTPARFVVPKDSDIEVSAEGLAGNVVGVQRATSFERFMNDTYPDVELRVYATQDEANLDLIAGRVDAVVADTVAMSENFLQKEDGKGFKFIGPSFNNPKWFGHGAGVAVRKDSPELRAMFDKAITELRENGTYQKISAQYFEFDVYGE